MQFFVIESEADAAQVLTAYFEAKGHTVTRACDGLEALQKFETVSPEVVLLETRLPRLDGWSVLEVIRRRSSVPVIILTNLSRADDVVRGLSLGADDYLRKPFQLSELEARIEAILRRMRMSSETSSSSCDRCRIDDRSKCVILDGRSVVLSPKEYKLLQLLATEPGRVFSSQEIIAQLWPGSSRADVNDVKQYVRLLRSRIEEDPAHPCWVQTVKGFGYRLTFPPES